MDEISDLQVMKSAAGYYLGHSYYDKECHAHLPYSRQSEYMSEQEAINLLASYNASDNDADMNANHKA